MTNIAKVQVVWEGFIGGPGVNTFYVDQETPNLHAFNTFYSALTGILPNEVSLTVPRFGTMLDSASGDVVAAWTGSDELFTDPAGTGPYAAGSGLVVRWETGVYLNSHRVIGKTFLVPCLGAMFTDTGQLADADASIVNNAVDDLISDLDGHLQVWHRPKGSVPGSIHQVQSGSVSLLPATLRSRKR